MHKPYYKLTIKKTNGFSLTQLLIGIAITLIIVHLTMINTRYLKKTLVQSHIEILFTTCLYLQRLAISSNTIQELSFNEKSNSYSYETNINFLATDIYLGIISGAKGPPSAPTSILTFPITFANKKIIFYPDGIISSGTVYLVDKTNNELYAMSSGIAHTSFLRKYHYDGKWHQL